jgi:phosphopantothenoylcysteine decarboxylase/phosphopantothenate--cysteine ligase
MAKILLGVCSSVAIHKACELVRELKHKNHQVKVVLTPTCGEVHKQAYLFFLEWQQSLL